MPNEKNKRNTISELFYSGELDRELSDDEYNNQYAAMKRAILQKATSSSILTSPTKPSTASANQSSSNQTSTGSATPKIGAPASQINSTSTESVDNQKCNER
ncbi:hypothetical protein [Neorickettsia helminthoeca]|uniref:hypothetical protein n=1 Tax=Neorickettsia helminthoeca TaxID=33994 RepID=UPI00056E368A|nr:hypothetical protein [Neorickettsia helminthoeca]